MLVKVNCVNYALLLILNLAKELLSKIFKKKQSLANKRLEEFYSLEKLEFSEGKKMVERDLVHVTNLSDFAFKVIDERGLEVNNAL